MEISGNFTVGAGRQRVWDMLNDPEVLASAIPGAERLVLEGENRYRAEMRVGVGIIRGRFTGTMEVRDRVPPESYRMIIEGKGAVGWVRGEGTLKLTEVSESETAVSVQGQAALGGLLARVGERVAGNVAERLMKQFFQDIEKRASAGRG